MRQPTLRILLLEDSPADAELVTLELRHAGLDAVTQRADTEDAFVRAVRDFAPDVVLSDHSLAQFNSTAALRLLPTIRPATPLIVVAGALDAQTVVDCLKAGAEDYVLKGTEPPSLGDRRGPRGAAAARTAQPPPARSVAAA